MKSETRMLRRAAAKGEATMRRLEFRTLKEHYDLTYDEIASLTGFHLTSLKQWGCGAKPLRKRILWKIRDALSQYGRAHKIESRSSTQPAA
jgi:hypothetical protein